MTVKDALEQCLNLCIGFENAVDNSGESVSGELAAISGAEDAIRTAIKSLEKLPPDHVFREDDSLFKPR